jgi:hypothetical protein
MRANESEDACIEQEAPPLTPLRQLHSLLTFPNKTWCDQSPESLANVVICKLSKVCSSAQL